jgi:PAS domain S-box-containing protein
MSDGGAIEEARRKAELSVRRLTEVQSLTHVGSWEWDLSEERPSWSPELRAIAGLEDGEPVPALDEFLESVHPDDRAGFLTSLQNSLESGGVRRNTYRVTTPAGEEKVIESHARVETDDSGTPVRVLGAAQDITERARDEASLRMQAGILDQVGVAVMASDTRRRLTHWNVAAEELFGVRREDALGLTVDEVMRIPPESQAEREAMVERLTAGQGWEGEIVLRGPDTATFPAYASNTPVRDGDGQIIGYTGVVMDLSEMKEARTELQRRAEDQAAIAALSRTGMASENLGALLEQAVGTVAERLGVELADLHELKADGQALRLRASLGRGETAVGGESSISDGSQAAHTLASPEPVVVADYAREERFEPPPQLREAGPRAGVTVAIEGGDVAYGVLGAYTAEDHSFSVDDIQFLQAVANVLAAAIARQRAQRLESQLHQNQRLEAVGQLAGGVAHDFNNLLVVILNYAEFLHKRIEDEQLREDVAEIKTAADRAAGLTHQLLVFSRREVVVPEDVDLNEVVESTEGLLRHSVREHIDLVHTSAAPGLWRVRLGSGQAEQILVNLLVNARDAMPDGGTVDIKTENLELEPGHGKQAALSDGRYVRLTIADSGTGMSEEVAAQAFDPFFTTKKDHGGTGLGLATVYGIVKEAGGHVEIYTERDQGTAFKIYLPAVVDEAAAVAGDTRETIDAAGETILLVEDEEKVRQLAERILVENGYRVMTALDGGAALELAGEHSGEIDLLLTDVVMPQISGPQLAKNLREVQPDLRALFMSGYTGEVISRHGVVEEGVSLIEKPFDSKGLLHAVSNALHGNHDGGAG